jgi:hypothetical protein
MNNIIAYIDGKISVHQTKTTENLGTNGFNKFEADYSIKILKELEEIRHFILNDFIKPKLIKNENP